METLQLIWLDIYPLVCIFIPCIIYNLCISVNCKRNAIADSRSLKYYVWSYIFILYLFLALNVAGSGGLWDIGKYPEIIRMNEINLIPFHSDGGLTYILNIIMFMPLGFLLPLIWEGFERIYRTIFTGFTFSLLIEFGQLFNHRQSDIDDLIMNTLGTIVGFGIWYLFRRIFKTRHIADSNVPFREANWYILLAVAGNFFLYNWRFFIHLFYD